METTLNQIEKNVAASFAYVKKDILMLNDSYTNMQEAITQLANSYKVLADEIKFMRNDLEKKHAAKNSNHQSLHDSSFIDQQIVKLQINLIYLKINQYEILTQSIILSSNKKTQYFDKYWVYFSLRNYPQPPVRDNS